MTKQVHCKLRVRGKVQGVWFRDSTRKKALELGVAGFVKNEPDGSVYIEAEGEEAAVEQLAAWCARGPELARVTSVERSEGVLENMKGFRITR